MAHSYKKIPVWKLHNCKYFKRLQHTRNRTAFRSGIYDISSKMYRHSVNSWDICDWTMSFWNMIGRTKPSYAREIDWFDYKRAMRK